jgi:hypothetical protein
VRLHLVRVEDLLDAIELNERLSVRVHLHP